jgi:hypothetical protein
MSEGPGQASAEARTECFVCADPIHRMPGHRCAASCGHPHSREPVSGEAERFASLTQELRGVLKARGHWINTQDREGAALIQSVAMALDKAEQRAASEKARADAAEKELRKRGDTIDWMLTDKRLAMERADAAEKRAERLEGLLREAWSVARGAAMRVSLAAENAIVKAKHDFDVRAALSGDGGQGRSEG